MHQRLQHADHAGKIFFFDLRYQALQLSSPSLRSLASVLKLNEFLGFHLKSCDEMEDEDQRHGLPQRLELFRCLSPSDRDMKQKGLLLWWFPFLVGGRVVR